MLKNTSLNYRFITIGIYTFFISICLYSSRSLIFAKILRIKNKSVKPHGLSYFIRICYVVISQASLFSCCFIRKIFMFIILKVFLRSFTNTLQLKASDNIVEV